MTERGRGKREREMLACYKGKEREMLACSKGNEREMLARSKGNERDASMFQREKVQRQNEVREIKKS